MRSSSLLSGAGALLRRGVVFAFLGYMSIANPLVAEPALGERVALVGNGLGERMLYYPHLETELQLRYPDQMLTLRNLCYPGDTAGFRPRAGNPDPWAFPGAEALRPEFAVHL